jgi:ribosomal protein S18 acetylase RimI-like enzyme
MGCDAIWLGVWEMNLRAIAIYRKCGFIEVGNQSFQPRKRFAAGFIDGKAIEYR